MSSYNIKARNKETNEIVKVACVDDWFRPREYGYFVCCDVFDMTYDTKPLTREEFYEKYEEITDEV
jgi:hypothetical protein